MRLALVIPGFQSDPHDWCIPAFTNLARELTEHVELHVFALRYPHRRDDYMIGRVHVHSIGGGAFGGFRLFGASLGKLWSDFQLKIEQVHAATPFDAVMAIWATESGWLAVRAARKLGLRSLVHLAGGEIVSIPYVPYGNRGVGLPGRMVPETLTNADLITVPSEPMERALHRMPNIDRKNVLNKGRRWAPGVDTDLFSPEVTDMTATGPFTFINVGSLVSVKGHRLLIRALARLRNRMRSDFNIYLRIVGSGPKLRNLQLEVERNKLEGYVTFEGEVTHERLPQLYRQASAFLLGSFHEAQCMAVLEAMSCGLPWVGPPVGILPNVARADVGETPTGMIFDSRDPGLVASTVQSMIELAPDECRRWGQQARSRVIRDYEMKKQAARLADVLGELTAR